MGRVRVVNFSLSRSGILVSIARSFRTSMFSGALFERAQTAGVISPSVMERAQHFIGPLEDSEIEPDEEGSSWSIWEAGHYAREALYKAGVHNYTTRTLGLASDDADPLATAVFRSRPSAQFQLPDATLADGYPAGGWKAKLIKFIEENDLGPHLSRQGHRCYQHVSFGGPSGVLLSAPHQTWNMASDIRGPDSWNESDPIAGSVVATLFPAKPANGGEGTVPALYHGQVLSFVELLFSDEELDDSIRLAYVKWRKVAKDSAKPMRKELSVCLIDATTGQPLPPAASAKWTAHDSARTTDRCYGSDEWIPLNRIIYQAALLPFADGIKLKQVLQVRV